MASREHREIDPLEIYPKPPFPAQQQQNIPGLDSELSPKADHGETSYNGSGRLLGKTALITGGDSGIGRAVAIAFAREGADVVISYLNEESDAQETLKFVNQAGRRGIPIPGDIQDEAHCERIISEAVKVFGRIDILVNNAAYQQVHNDISEISTADFDKTFKTNVYSMFYLCRAAVPHMKPGSSIINTASIEAYQPDAELLAYATTKGAIVTFSKGLAKGLAKKGIRVNIVAPGPVWTPLIPSTLPSEVVKTFGHDTPMGRAAQPVELAPIFVLLASDEGSYITGMTYGATGGAPLM